MPQQIKFKNFIKKRKHLKKKEETPQQNKVLKLFSKNGNASKKKKTETPQKKEETPQL